MEDSKLSELLECPMCGNQSFTCRQEKDDPIAKLLWIATKLSSRDMEILLDLMKALIETEECK